MRDAVQQFLQRRCLKKETGVCAFFCMNRISCFTVWKIDALDTKHNKQYL